MKKRLLLTFNVFLLLGIALQNAYSSEVFNYDKDAIPKAKPWTSENFKNDPEDFQFAVIGDRTGGADPQGVFVRAIDQLNLLQPEFVINVGDLVEGYTDDKATASAMWDEVEPVINKLEMPFFYTAGNHDLGNDTMQQVWQERFGAAYYHFVYRDVLFVILNTEDPSNPMPEGVDEKTALYKKLQKEDPAAAQAMLEEFMDSLASYRVPAQFSDQQMDYVKKVLQENTNVRWTFFFLHQPVWENPPEKFLTLEQQLKDRPYTFIAGHLHYYDIESRNDRDYITMGPAGASWHKDGGGNVDHILWVTMKGNTPEIAKITMDGIHDRQGRSLELKQKYDRESKNKK